jgi:hypothetical protein
MGPWLPGLRFETTTPASTAFLRLVRLTIATKMMGIAWMIWTA